MFGVSPGAPELLMAEVDALAMPFLPGCAAATEAMALANRGYQVLKYFPAGAAGGVAFLSSLASPLPDIGFCPTGGISLDNAPDYLGLPNMRAVGGSWVASKKLIDRGDWARSESLARDVVNQLRPIQC